MTILGAILAGGRSTRFGSDKAVAMLHGRALIDHVIAGLRDQVDSIVVCGRAWSEYEAVKDWPAPDLGPLGGICGVLRHAAAQGHDHVLTAGCDVLPIPADLLTRLTPGPAMMEGQPLFALWPVRLAPHLEAWLAHGDDRSIRRWAAAVETRIVPFPDKIANLNTPEALQRYSDEMPPAD